MAFPLKLASHLTGATPFQLRKWRLENVLVPEVSESRPPLYSFRDLVALRSMVFLRAKTSSQRLMKAMSSLEQLNMVHLVEHPAEYQFGTDGKRIYVRAPDDGENAVDLTGNVGNTLVRYTFEELFDEFLDFKDRPVVNFRNPAPSIEVNPRRLGGWPTVEGTRVSFDAVARAIDGEDLTVEEVAEVYPSVTPAQALEAISFNERVEAVAV
ncbi:DUF433 domain-containing protein [Leucobacter chromiireducens]|uniref:DUF433 domain-containing protein n=1 Tax=Leucobacter chromiireducens TaxID=283877 RepID=UPI000F64294C|nr:DUF433 domain-containing protein [Leucobacter chromiireducens]